MSTKIYEGFRLTSNVYQLAPVNTFDMMHVDNFFSHLREQMTEYAGELALEQFTHQVVRQLDREACGLKSIRADDNHNSSMMFRVWWEMCKHQREYYQQNKRDPLYDFEVSVTLHPVQSEQVVVGIFFGEKHQLRNKWYEWFDVDTKQPLGLSEFAYFNNTDIPDGLSEQDWEWRRQVWEKATLDNYDGMPSMNGFQIQLVEPGIPARVIDEMRACFAGEQTTIHNYMHDFNTRAHHVVVDMMRERFFKQRQDLKNEDVFDATRAFNQYIKSSDGVAEYQCTFEQVKPKLKQELETSDLTI